MSYADLEVSRAYHRAYFRRNADRLNANARHHQQLRYWCTWLLANLEWPEEPTPIYPKSYPIRRPTLRLSRSSA